MPVYDCRLNEPLFGVPPAPDVPPGAEPFPRFDGKPGRLVDATGQVVGGYYRGCDTETGEVDRYDVRDGKFRIDPQTRRVVVLRVAYPAPLAYLPPDEG
jgi:hypothetical protein